MTGSPYNVGYDGYYTMSWHDREENALKRWFDNFKQERYASFASDTEWLVVKEVPAKTKRKVRYVCEIGDDGRGTKREVAMDHTAPPAPMLTFAAKRQYVPPPPKTAAELRKEAEWDRMYAMGYEPIRRPKRRPIMVIDFDAGGLVCMEDLEYEIEWVPRRWVDYMLPATPYRAPPPPQHRRN